MSLGPVEMLCIKFPNSFIKDEIASALKALVENKTIRIIDILFVRKSESGEVTMTEIDEMEDVDHSILDPIIADISGLIAEEDVQTIAQSLDNNSFAALMLFENIWATTFRDAVLKADGQLLLSERIPSSVIEEVMAAQV
ncbi:MAG: hypothetical protein DCF22_09545 [Leptolyngbya sp.]|nr:MAG: hypothetical protein DCF22_09545 [Leptolyngbya sp.]